MGIAVRRIRAACTNTSNTPRAVSRPRLPVGSSASTRSAWVTIARVPGFEADHVIALCSGGSDHPRKMERRTREDHALKSGKRTSTLRRDAVPPKANPGEATKPVDLWRWR